MLRLDGVLEFDDDLVARIDAGELLEHDSPEEVEIRACALHAVELLVAAHPEPTTATAVDNELWHRGGGPALQGAPAPPRPHDRLLGRGACCEGQRHRLHLLGLDQEHDAGAHRERAPVYLTARRSMISNAASPSTVPTTRPRTWAIR